MAGVSNTDHRKKNQTGMKNFNQNKTLSQQSHIKIEQIQRLVFNDAKTQDLWKRSASEVHSHIFYKTSNLYKITREKLLSWRTCKC